MLCPVCKTKLKKAILHGVEVDFCPKCLGIWFEQEELRWAKDNTDKDLKWLDIDLWKNEKEFQISGTHKICPRCRLLLYEINYGKSPIKIDICKRCHGVWLDRGEFKKIITYLEKEQKLEILHHYTKNVIREAWEIINGPETWEDEVLDLLIILKLLNYKLGAQMPILTKLIASLPK